jgi:NAD(P)-dependent dehydrogenase (short-subunit alcohol dehydrogenase family)
MTMNTQKTAVIIGVGPLQGLGAYLCRYAAAENLHVFGAGRTTSNLEAVAATITDQGGAATAVVTDATSESAVVGLFERAEAAGPVDLAIYNAGNNFPGSFLEMEAAYFEQAWRVACFGGFLFAREALRHMQTRGSGTLIFTGASASMRGKPNFAAFAAAKSGLRAIAQSLAREFGPLGIHVAHVVIDGGIKGDKILTRYPDILEQRGEDGLIDIEGIASAYMFLYKQAKGAWTHELDLRTHKESF